MRAARRPFATRRGITFLEVVLASALLGLVSLGVLSALNYMLLQQRRGEQVRGAAEVANRVVVMYLDNPEGMPASGQPIASGRHLYRWRYEASPITLFDPNAEGDEGASPLTLDRLQELTVTVWLHEDTGGSYEPRTGTPAITIRRMLDPVPTRNPDTLAAAIADGRLLRGVSGSGGPATTGGSQGGAQTETGGN